MYIPIVFNQTNERVSKLFLKYALIISKTNTIIFGVNEIV